LAPILQGDALDELWYLLGLFRRLLQPFLGLLALGLGFRMLFGRGLVEPYRFCRALLGGLGVFDQRQYRSGPTRGFEPGFSGADLRFFSLELE